MKRFFSTARLREGLGRLPYGSTTLPLVPRGGAGFVVKLAVIFVIAVILWILGSGPLVALLFLGFGWLIVFAIWRPAKRKTEFVFTFYVAADEVLRDEERRRYRFEVADVINAGERVIHSMPDPPPLSRFALGALYSFVGEHNGVVEHLGIAAEEQVLKDSAHIPPSRLLRRYVKKLRQIERTPERSPRIYAAIKSLERMHELRAARMLAESQQHLKRLVEAYDSHSSSQMDRPIFMERSLRSLTPPRPISELLNDIYQEEQQTS